MSSTKTLTSDDEVEGTGGVAISDLEEIAISGISGRLPQSENVQDFGQKILDGQDLVTEDDSRWDIGFYGLPKRHAKLKDIAKFDAQFFGVSPRQANCMDPQLRMLQEVAYEAIVDAGVNPKDLRGRRVGVFVGCSASETQDFLALDLENVEGYTLTGCQRSMFANRLSYAFDLRGPSFAVDTACSSSLLALQLAVDAMRGGQCESALVCGAHLTLVPTTSLQFHRLGVLSPSGTCRSFDNAADGYCRSEGIVAVFLQKLPAVRRCYATVVHARSNTDGFKEQGITFPGGDRQATLLRETYAEAGVDPNDVKLIEAHGTGTMAGDPQEANAVADVLCQNRNADNPLLIGSVKSNMGHSEPASGLAALAKVVVAMECGIIPPSLHFTTPNQYIPALSEGRLKVVTERTPWDGGLVGINSFGFGGSNTHVILRSFTNPGPATPLASAFGGDLPLLFCYSARTEEGATTILEAFLEKHQEQQVSGLFKLACETANPAIQQCPYRGFAIVDRETETPIKSILKAKPASSEQSSPPIWFIFSGMGTQYPGMGRELLRLPVFSVAIDACTDALRHRGVNIRALIEADDQKAVFDDTFNCIVTITAIQIGLTEALKEIGVRPDGIVGHSMGEMACAYADGALTLEQTMMLAYYRALTITGGGLASGGAMAAVGLTWEQAQEQCPPGVYPACHNGKNSVTISGPADKVEQFVAELKEKELFAKVVNSAGVPFHTPMMAVIKPLLTERLKLVIPAPKARSARWISSSVPESDWQSAGECSAEYHVNNVLSPVLFYEALQHIPDNAITIEVAPHCVLQAILRRNLPSTCSNVGLMKAHQPQPTHFLLNALGRIYQAGCAMRVDSLYPPVSYPVSPGTPMVAPLVRWEHAVDWPVIDSRHPSLNLGRIGADSGPPANIRFTWDPHGAESKDAYILDHRLNGRAVFPLTGHLVMVWKAACQIANLEQEETPVLIENVSVYRATFLQKAVTFDVILLPGDGHFNIMEGDQIVMNGTVTLLDENDRKKAFFYEKKNETDDAPCRTCEAIELTEADIYKELRTRGYEYGPKFRGMKLACGDKVDRIDCEWTDNWVCFMDYLLQVALLYDKSHDLLMPIRIRYLRVDPQRHRDSVFVDASGRRMIRMRTDPNSVGCVAGGVEMFRVDYSVQKPKQHAFANGRLSIEKLYFMPHFDQDCLSQFPSESAQLIHHERRLVELLSAQCADWLTDGRKKMLSTLWPHPNRLRSALTATLRQIGDKADRLDEQEQEDPNGTLYEYLQKMIQMAEEWKDDTDSPVDSTAAQSSRLRWLSMLERDRLWASVSVQRRALVPMVEIAVENVPGTVRRCLAVDMTSVDQIKKLVELLLSHPLISCRWTLIGEQTAALDADQLKQLPCKVTKNESPLDDAVVETLKQSDGFDLALVDKTLCLQTDLDGYLTRLKALMSPDGFVIVNEITRNFPLAYFVHGVDSIDVEGREFGVYQGHDAWMDTFERNGFNVVSYQTDPALITTMYLIRVPPKMAKEPTLVDVDDVKDFSWIDPLKTAINEAHEQENRTTWIVSNRQLDNGALGLAHCLRLENMSENRFRCLADVSLKGDVSKGADANLGFAADGDGLTNVIRNDLHSNNFRDGVWGNFVPITVKEDERHVYGATGCAFLTNLSRGDLSSLRWVRSAFPSYGLLTSEERRRFGVFIDIYLAALNFRDVMVATGRISADQFSDSPDRTYFCPADRDCVLGIEFAGRRRDNGQRVMGVCSAQGLATVTITKPKYMWSISDRISLEEAATIPIAYTTAYYALVVRARIRHGETLLIHSGSGAVGQAAIAVALSYDCEVYTTVGSDEKRRFLQERFPSLTDQHFANSRTAQFEYDIMQATSGRGVDIVLNSLAGEMLQASVRCLAQHGRFLEIGKYDIQVNSNLGMATLARNISFHAIFVDQLMQDVEIVHPDWPVVYKLIEEGLKSGVVQPLSRSVFDKNQAEDAFRFMASGKHVGKVLLRICDEEQPQGSLPPCLLSDFDERGMERHVSGMSVDAVLRTVCHPKHVYLITGGLGGFGLELANWLFNRGAKCIVLSSRSGVRTNYQRRWLNEWRKAGYTVHVCTEPIGTEDGCRKLIQECQRHGIIGGVFHLALVLRDQLFEDQTVQNFQEIADGKYWGTRNLDTVTEQLCGDKLKWFVVFSSMSARGNGGQTSYGWANSAMERIVERRRARGLPAVAVQWGGVGDVGAIFDGAIAGDNYTLLNGTYPQRMFSCLQMLDHFLAWDHPIVSSFVRALQDVTDSGVSGADRGASMIQSIARIVGVSDVAQLNKESTLADLGLDSLMGVEIKQVLEREYDIFLSPKDIRSLTLTKLEQMASGEAPSVSARDAAQQKEEMDGDAAETTVGEGYSVDGSADEQQLQSIMQQQFRLRMDVNDIGNYQRLLKLNNATEGRPVFFLHSIEGVATTGAKALCQRVPVPVYCIQWHPSVDMTSMETVAHDYIKVLKEAFPNESAYRLLGYSYGVSIGIAMATQLQQLDGPSAVDKLVFIDGSHSYMRKYRNVYRKIFGASLPADLMNSPLFEAELLCVFASRMELSMTYGQLRNELLAKADWQQRVEHVVDVVSRVGAAVKFEDKQTLRDVCQGIRGRLFCADKFDPKVKFQGDAHLVRSNQEVKMIELEQDYDLGEIVTGSVSVHFVDGDHDSMVHGESSVKTAEIISQIFTDV